MPFRDKKRREPRISGAITRKFVGYAHNTPTFRYILLHSGRNGDNWDSFHWGSVPIAEHRFRNDRRPMALTLDNK